MTRKPNEAQLLLADVLRDTGYEWEPEYKIVAGRKWAYDFACRELKLAIELHGATWVQGRHNRGAGFQNDRSKMNAAVVRGWSVLEFTTEDVLKGRAAATVRDWFERAPERAGIQIKGEFLEVRKA